MTTDLRTQIEAALQSFPDTPLRSASMNLLGTLGYKSEKTLDLDGSPDAFVEQFDNSQDQPLNKEKALFDDWKSVEFLFQLTDEELAGHAPLKNRTPKLRNAEILHGFPLACLSAL